MENLNELVDATVIAARRGVNALEVRDLICADTGLPAYDVEILDVLKALVASSAVRRVERTDSDTVSCYALFEATP